MFPVISSAMSGGSSLQSNRLALLVKLFQTSGKPAQDKKDVAATAPPPPPPPPAPQSNSAAGLAAMFESLQTQDSGTQTDLVPQLLQAVDTDGDGLISVDELQAVTKPTLPPTGLGAQRPESGPLRPGLAPPVPDVADGDRPPPAIRQIDTIRLAETAAGRADLTLSPATMPTAYEALFQALQLVLAPANPASGTMGSRRYADVLQSLARAG